MDLLNSIANGIKKGYENGKKAEQNRKERLKDLAIPLDITFGYREIGIPANSIMKQQPDGIVYFNFAFGRQFRLIGYEWNGTNYEQHTLAETNGDMQSTTVKKGKSGRMAAGAIIGTMLMPGVGTAVGAAIGAGGKSKTTTKASNHTQTQQVTRNVETDSQAIIRLQSTADNSIHAITFKCNSDIDAKIRCFNIDLEKNISDISEDINNSLSGVKALKELLDMGAITQEEYDRKKEQILKL
ncbi:MAG: SHOCT domain-containing protein [Lachnospiraceae bacterium]|nr:SHOCT domain-containing protein [Lachnospiraceae bacterium]